MFCYEVAIKTIQNFRTKNKKCISNCFLNSKEILDISAISDSIFLYDEHVILIVMRDEYVYRGYFFIDALENIESLGMFMHSTMVSRTVIFDYLTKDENNNDVTNALMRIGIKLYSKQCRWRASHLSKIIKNRRNNDSLVLADSNNVDAISNVLKSVFDPFVSHLPSREKLITLIHNRCVYCALYEQEIIGVWICELRGKRSVYFYQNAIMKNYQGTGIGILLFHYAVSNYLDYQDFSAWVEESNTASINMHKYVGMKRDGLNNYIYIFERNDVGYA